MTKITQYSRLQHHTLTTSGSTFSVPTSEDDLNTWSSTDLALSELGVNEGSGKVFIRVGSQVKEIPLIATGATTLDYLPLTGGTLTGPTTGTSFISDSIKSKTNPSNTFFILNDDLTISTTGQTDITALRTYVNTTEEIGLTTDGGIYTTPHLYMTTTGSFLGDLEKAFCTGDGTTPVYTNHAYITPEALILKHTSKVLFRTSGATDVNTVTINNTGMTTSLNVVFEQTGKGPVLTSPDGTLWRIRVDNSGNLTAVTL